MTVQSWVAAYAQFAALLLPVVCCAGIGALWYRAGTAYPADFVAQLATVVSTPALVFHTLVTAELDDTQFVDVAMATCLGLVVSASVSALLLAALRWPVRAFTAAATFPNAGNLGLPIAYLAFGHVGLTIAVVFFAVNSVVQHTLGVWFTSGGRKDGHRWPKSVASACALGVLVRIWGVQVPTPVLDSARLVGSLAVPLMLVSLGYALVTGSRDGLRRGAGLGTIRLIAGLSAGATVVHVLQVPALIASVVALQLAMPVAVVSAIYVQRFSDHGEVAAGAVLVSTAVFLLLSPIVMFISA